MPLFNFTKPEKEEIIQKIRNYFSDELDQDIGQFEAGFLLDFISEHIGPYFYNKGVHDSQAIVQKQIDTVIEAVDSLSKPLPVRRKTGG